MEQAPAESGCEQSFRESIELRREELCCRVRDVEVGAWLVRTQSHDDREC